jgi:hypothetical protein
MIGTIRIGKLNMNAILEFAAFRRERKIVEEDFVTASDLKAEPCVALVTGGAVLGFDDWVPAHGAFTERSEAIRGRAQKNRRCDRCLAGPGARRIMRAGRRGAHRDDGCGCDGEAPLRPVSDGASRALEPALSLPRWAWPTFAEPRGWFYSDGFGAGWWSSLAPVRMRWYHGLFRLH